MHDVPPNETPGPTQAAVATFTVLALFAFLLVGGTSQLVNLAWGLWFSEVFLFFGLTWLGLQALGYAPGRSLGLAGFPAGATAAGVAFGLVNHFAWALPLMWLSHQVLPRELIEKFDAAQVFARPSPAETVIVALGAGLVAPLCEEVFFRGFLQQGLRVRAEAPRAIVVTALIFTAFHLEPVGFVARFELGVLFGLLYWRTGSLWPAIGAHVANNVTSTLLHFATKDLPNANEPLPWWLPLTMFVVGNGLLVLLVWSVGPRITRPETSPWTPGPRPSLVALVNWLGAAVASVVLLLAVDLRGVQLNLLDALNQPSKVVKARDDVKELRARARRGEASLDDYEALLKSLK